MIIGTLLVVIGLICFVYGIVFMVLIKGMRMHGAKVFGLAIVLIITGGYIAGSSDDDQSDTEGVEQVNEEEKEGYLGERLHK